MLLPPPPPPSDGQCIDISIAGGDKYSKGLCLLDIIVTRYLPFLLVPLIGYLTMTYVYPMISFHLKQYSKAENSVCLEQVVHLHSDEETDKMMVVKKLKLVFLECLLVANCYVYFVLMWLYISPSEFLSTIDNYIAYIFDKALVTMLLFGIVIAGFCFKERKISIISLISLSFSVNIVCLVCYVFPKMLVGFTYDLLHTLAVIFIIISLYPLIWYFYVLILLLKLHLKQAYLNLFSYNGLLYCLISVALMVLFCCMGVIASIDIMKILKSDSDYLELLCLLIHLLLICLVKPVNHCLYDHAIENAKLMMLHVFNYDNSWPEDNEEKISTYQSGNHDIGSKETDNHFQSNESIVV